VAQSLLDYLLRHPEIDQNISKNKTTKYLTTENAADFDIKASAFIGIKILSEHVNIISNV